MAKLQVMDPVGLGDFLIKAATDKNIRQALLADPVGQLKKFVNVPTGHTIVVHEDSESVTHLMIPWEKDIKNTLASMAAGQAYSYPKQYNPNDLAFIDPSVGSPNPSDDPPLAYKFRVGDYSLSRCG